MAITIISKSKSGKFSEIKCSKCGRVDNLYRYIDSKCISCNTVHPKDVKHLPKAVGFRKMYARERYAQ